MRSIRPLLAAALIGLAGCARHSDRPVSTLTEHQRDSVLSRSDLPGSRVVGRAMAEVERSSHRDALLDSLSR